MKIHSQQKQKGGCANLFDIVGNLVFSNPRTCRESESAGNHKLELASSNNGLLDSQNNRRHELTEAASICIRKTFLPETADIYNHKVYCRIFRPTDTYNQELKQQRNSALPILNLAEQVDVLDKVSCQLSQSNSVQGEKRRTIQYIGSLISKVSPVESSQGSNIHKFEITSPADIYNQCKFYTLEWVGEGFNITSFFQSYLFYIWKHKQLQLQKWRA